VIGSGGIRRGIRCLCAVALLASPFAAPARAGGSYGGAPASPVVDTTAFQLFAWSSPPADSTSDARIAEMAALSLTLTLPALNDEGKRADNLYRLDLAAAHGMRCWIWDRRLEGALQWLPTFEDTLDSVAADYRGHPAFYGYYLGDEPPLDLWPLLRRLREALRSRDPDHPCFNNLLGYSNFNQVPGFTNYLQSFAEQVRPSMLCDDHYDFLETGDRNAFVLNTVLMHAVADPLGLPMWNILQLVPHLFYRPLGHGEMRWQVAHQLAYGARGIGYFTYWTPSPDDPSHFEPAVIDYQGMRTPWYDFLRDFNMGVRLAGEILAKSSRQRTMHSGSLPIGGTAFSADAWLAGVTGRACLGEFTGPSGQPLLLVANSDSASEQTVTLELTHASSVRVLASGSGVAVPPDRPLGWDARVPLTLAAGDFALVTFEPLAARPSPLALAPNPGRDVIRFAPVSPAAGARLDILDLGGRVLWTRSPGAGAIPLEWRGERDDGGRARPGLYFARLRSGGIVTTSRFAWLGAK
jgi:hypothetical protein